MTAKQRLSILPLIFTLPASSAPVEIKPYETPTGHTPFLNVEESLKTFHLPEGYSLEPVLTEPHISEPVVTAFDGNGRLYVVEMNTYMQDAEATGENDPKSRVSWHEDTNGDGKMDKHGIFVDNLVLPRTILPLDDRVLIQESFDLDVYAYRDTNGDGKADEKKLFCKIPDRTNNMEHQPSGLIWSMDNWIYTTYSSQRIRYNANGETITEATPYSRGQWGLCQDNYGKPWLTKAGSEKGPIGYQQHMAYGLFDHPKQTSVDYPEVFPLVGLPDVQGGAHRYRSANKTLNHFTSVCGQEIVRGDKYPDALKGSLLFAEPAGRLIRQSNIEVKDGITHLTNAHPGAEFIRSTDPNFRPVNAANGPDGCLYITDMYRGIIQQAKFMPKGSHLHKIATAYGLDKNIGKGRIYRLVHKNHLRDTKKPNMLAETPAQLVAHLSHPNGWWRDTAQKLLIIKNAPSVVPTLESLARSSASDSNSELAKLHALWTLEGLNALSPDLVRHTLSSSSPSLRSHGLRLSESLYKKGDKSFANDIKAKFKDPDSQVVSQSFLTANKLNLPQHRQDITAASATNQSEGVKNTATQLLTEKKKQPHKLTKEQMVQYKKGEKHYQMICAACHAKDGTGTKPAGTDLLLAPSLVSSPRIKAHPEALTKVLLHGLAGPLEKGATYPSTMIGMTHNGNEWIADVLSYIRTDFGDNAGFVSTKEVTAIREKDADRKTPWTLDELTASSPDYIADRSQWKLTASHNPSSLTAAIDNKLKTRYTSGTKRVPNMWVQIELPNTETLVGLVLDSTPSAGDSLRKYKVETSTDGKSWNLLANNRNRSPLIKVYHKPRQARFIKITSIDTNKARWSIHELNLIKAGKR